MTLSGEAPPAIRVTTGRPDTTVRALQIWRSPPLRIESYPAGVPAVDIRVTIRIVNVVV